MRLAALGLSLVLTTAGCADDRRIEEPVKTTAPQPNAGQAPSDDDAGFSDAAGEPKGTSDLTAPAGAPAPEESKRTSGDKVKIGAECAKIKDTRARQDCVARAEKAEQH